MTNDQDIYRERIASDADATPADQFKPPATISEYIESPAVRKMALYGIIGGVVGIALAALLIFLIGLVFGGSGGATIDASRFGRHDDFIGSAIALLLFVEVLAAMIVGAASLVSIGIGLGVRRAATYHDNPDGYVAIAVALGLCVLGTHSGC